MERGCSLKKQVKLLSLITIFLFGIVNLWGQTIQVTDGISSEEKQTKIVFNAVNNKPAEIFQILSFSQSFGTTVGVIGGNVISGNTNRFGTNTAFVCTTPAEIKLDKGQLKLQVTNDSVMTGAIFTISATGGTQYWDIRNANTGLFTSGMLLTIFGGTAAICGFICYGCAPDLFEASLPIGIVGTIATIAGIPMMCMGKAKATLIRIEY